MGYGVEFICNGCGAIVVDVIGQQNHLETCEISKIRIALDKKTKGKSTFTNVK